MNETTNPWKILTETPVYNNPWIQLTEYAVINPSGGKGIYGKVHFKNIAIGIIVLDEDFNTWLVGQYRFPIDQYSWEIPEGGGIMGTDPLGAAKRELQEETGLSAGKWTTLMHLHLSNSVTDEYCIIFLARDIVAGQASPEETESLIVRKLPFNDVYELVNSGEITDVITVAAVLKLKLMIAEGKLAQ